jgi:hypothetical protein
MMESCRIRKVKQKKDPACNLGKKKKKKKKDPACNLGNRESHTKKKTKNLKGIGNN